MQDYCKGFTRALHANLIGLYYEVFIGQYIGPAGICEGLLIGGFAVSWAAFGEVRCTLTHQSHFCRICMHSVTMVSMATLV